MKRGSSGRMSTCGGCSTRYAITGASAEKRHEFCKTALAAADNSGQRLTHKMHWRCTMKAKQIISEKSEQPKPRLAPLDEFLKERGRLLPFERNAIVLGE